MKFGVVTFGLLLPLGAMLNIAVAWTCHIRPCPATSVSYLPNQNDLDWWQRHAPSGFPATPVGIRELQGFGHQTTVMYEREPDEANHTLGDNASLDESGWPFLSMQGSMWVNRTTRMVVDQNIWRIPQGWPLGGRWFPLQPLWTGVVINSVFYAVLLMVIGLTIQRIRGKRRLKRAMCPKCRGPIGQSHVCTECGTVL